MTVAVAAVTRLIAAARLVVLDAALDDDTTVMFLKGEETAPPAPGTTDMDDGFVVVVVTSAASIELVSLLALPNRPPTSHHPVLQQLIDSVEPGVIALHSAECADASFPTCWPYSVIAVLYALMHAVSAPLQV